MRTKDEILGTFQEKEREGIDAVEIMSIAQTQLLEVLIDIRDILNEMLIAKGESPLDTLLKS